MASGAQKRLATRRKVLERDRYTCRYCQTVMEPDAATVDHVKPRSQGGRSDVANLVACCSLCNQKKADGGTEHAAVGAPSYLARMRRYSKPTDTVDGGSDGD